MPTNSTYFTTPTPKKLNTLSFERGPQPTDEKETGPQPTHNLNKQNHTQTNNNPRKKHIFNNK